MTPFEQIMTIYIVSFFVISVAIVGIGLWLNRLIMRKH